MLEPHLCKTAYALHLHGLSARKIARRLNVSRNSIRQIIAQKGGAPPASLWQDWKIPLDEELLRSLYAECQGRAQRLWEKLTEEHKTKVSYATLTRRLRELHISQPLRTRCHRVDDEPGQEMQHDTTLYQVPLGE